MSQRTDDLIESRDRLLEPDSWCKDVDHKIGANGSRFCLLGSAWFTAGLYDFSPNYTSIDKRNRRINEIETAMKATAQRRGYVLGPDGKHPVARFNDAPVTTHADVLDFMDDAIKISKEWDDESDH